MSTGARTSPVRVRDVLAAMPDLRDHMLEAAIRTNWTQAVGPELSGHSRPGVLRYGTLEVIVDSSPWLQEMTLRSGEMLSAIQARHSSSLCSLRFVLGTVPVKPRPVVVPRTPSAPALAGEEARWVDALVAPVPDPSLAGSVRRLLTKDVLSRRRPSLTHRSDASSPDRKDA
ncbi:MAG: hypothetical protein C5B48_12480 [Candidatus Rokuibacteriota bacterium]|nr:MAG: hypothetical protein C5B48_12480 [Candidatus Rokubacteria bacterium]